MDLSADRQLIEFLPEMVAWRRHLHRHPELSYQEEKTAAFVAEKLERLGLAVRRNVGGHGVIAELEGAEAGPTVALRADIDALPIQDEKQCEYASTVPGVMHACGHDAHTSALLGVAHVLSGMKEQIKGRVRFLFQPAEEVSPGGALPLIKEGALEGVAAIYGVHLWSPFPVGAVYSRPGPLMASADDFTIDIIGKGGHGGLPHETVDSLMVGAHLVVNLQSIVSRNVNPVDPAVISVGSLQAGTGFNVIAERSRLKGTVRCFSADVRAMLKTRIEQVIASTCSMFGADYELHYKLGYPPVVNDPAEVRRFTRVAADLFGAEKVRQTELIMAGEDFSYYLQQVPGCFVFVGAGNAEKLITAPHHHPRFDIDEEAMLHAARVLAGLCLDRLHGNN